MHKYVGDQQVFDKVAKHLLQQMAHSANEDGDCRYRSNDLRCAIGCLIPERIYEPRIEGKNVRELVRGRLVPEIADLFHSDVDILLLYRLQRVHDAYDVAVWRKELERVADEFRLSTEVLNDI